MKSVRFILKVGIFSLILGCSAVILEAPNTPAAEGCREGSHFENNECVLDSVIEDCTGSVDTDGDGKVPALDSDCIEDAGFGNPDGNRNFPCDRFCVLISPALYIQTDGGRSYHYKNGDAVPMGAGIIQTEVGLPDAFALKLCYSADTDADGDGITNCADNCWRHPNPRPRGCTSNQGCVNAGGICLANGTCIGQVDTDHDDMGDVCDNNQGHDDSKARYYPDPDPDYDGIPYYDDACADMATTPTENATDADNDGVPNLCDNCAYPDMSCQL